MMLLFIIAAKVCVERSYSAVLLVFSQFKKLKCIGALSFYDTERSNGNLFLRLEEEYWRSVFVIGNFVGVYFFIMCGFLKQFLLKDPSYLVNFLSKLIIVHLAAFSPSEANIVLLD